LSKKTASTKQLLKSRAIFNFVTAYVKKNPVVTVNDFKVSEKEFRQFQEYIKLKDTTFVTASEKKFKEAYDSMKKKEVVSKEYQQIIKKIKDQKVKEIETNKDHLIPIIEDEIIERYFYQKGKYQHQLKKDKMIKEAVTLLKNKKKYQQILASKK